MKSFDESPRRKQRGILADHQFFYAASGGEYNPKRFKRSPSASRTHGEGGIFRFFDPTVTEAGKGQHAGKAQEAQRRKEWA